MQRSMIVPSNMKQIAGLDGLRAIAITGIVLYHVFPHTATGGFLGVSLFFVLSGYLLAVTSRTAWRQGQFELKSFYWKRILRIYPPLILMICTTAFFLLILAPASLRGIRSEILSILTGCSNWRQIILNTSYFTRITGTSAFTHLWSLAVEIQYYLIWPFLFLLCMTSNRRRRRYRVIWFLLVPAICSALGMALLYQAGSDTSRIYYGTDTRLFSLLLGSALGLGYVPRKSRNQNRMNCYWKLAFFILTMAGTVILFFQAKGQSAITYRAVLPLSSLLFTGLVALTAARKLPFVQWLDCRPLSWIGARSYEIYLCQYPVIFFVQRWRPDKSPLVNAAIELILILCFSAWLNKVTFYFRKKRKARV